MDLNAVGAGHARRSNHSIWHEGSGQYRPMPLVRVAQPFDDSDWIDELALAAGPFHQR